MTDKAKTTNLTASERRAMGDYAKHANYRGQVSMIETLSGLETKGLLKRIEVAADRKPVFVLTTTGKRIVSKL